MFSPQFPAFQLFYVFWGFLKFLIVRVFQSDSSPSLCRILSNNWLSPESQLWLILPVCSDFFHNHPEPIPGSILSHNGIFWDLYIDIITCVYNIYIMIIVIICIFCIYIILYTHIFIRLHFNDLVYVMPSSQVSHEEEPQKTVASTFQREAFLGALGKLWEVPQGATSVGRPEKSGATSIEFCTLMTCFQMSLWGYWVHRSMWRATYCKRHQTNGKIFWMSSRYLRLATIDHPR